MRTRTSMRAWYALARHRRRDRDRHRAHDRVRAVRRAQYSSAALSSNALHFASDLGGSIAVLVGLLLVRAGYQKADSIAALFVACSCSSPPCG